MDFLLKKFVSLCLMPLPLGAALIILGLFFLYKNKPTKSKVALALGIGWLFLFSYPPVTNILLHSLESSYPTLHQAPKDVKYIYILGAGHKTDDSLPITSQLYTTAVIRLNEGIRLYQQLDEKATLIVSGYNGLFDPTTHAQMQEKLALALGVKKDHIILRPTPRDTQEEAIAAKQLLEDKSFILVTSASHMKRAMIFFKDEGLHPIPAPTNHLSSTKRLDYTNLFSSDALGQSHIVFHEYLGLIWQKIKGF